MNSENLGVWACFFSDDAFERLDLVKRRAGRIDKQILFWAPPIPEITLADGLWSELNDEFDTLFDRAEEEDLEPELAVRISHRLKELALERYDDITIQILVGERNGKPVIAREKGLKIREALQELATFLDEMAAMGKTTVVSL